MCFRWNRFVKKAKKVVANFVFLLLQKRKKLFRHWRKKIMKNDFRHRQKRFVARSGRKELLYFVIWPQNEFIFPTFLCFWLKLFLENFIKRIVVVGNNLFRHWRKCFTNKSGKNNNRFFLSFNNKREKKSSFSQKQFHEVSANFFVLFSKWFQAVF